MSYDFSDNQSDFSPPVFKQSAYSSQFSSLYQRYLNQDYSIWEYLNSGYWNLESEFQVNNQRMMRTKLPLQIIDRNVKSKNDNIDNTTIKLNLNINSFLWSDQQSQNQLVQTNSIFSLNQYQNYESYQNWYKNDYQLQTIISVTYNSYSKELRSSDIFRYFRSKDQSQDHFKNSRYTDIKSEENNTENKNKQQSIGEESTDKDNQNLEV